MKLKNYAIHKVINGNEEWARVRKRLAEFPPHFHSYKTIELLDVCRASRLVRYLDPYISLSRLGLHRYDTYEAGIADDFLCLYFHQNQYVVSTYDNYQKWFFSEAQEAVEFVKRNLDKEKVFS